jgi:aspartate kinase
MSRFHELVDHLFLDGRGEPAYDRVVVVSAYGGMTDLLLEHKHSGEPGVFSLFSEGDNADDWQDQLSDVGRRMREVNQTLHEQPVAVADANRFVDARVQDARQCLEDVQRICSFGPFALDGYLDRVRELLSSMGEAHSAYNTAMLLRARGVSARFVDLSGWRDQRSRTLDERIRQGLSDVDTACEIPIVTGYAQCDEGLVRRFGRGYTEITMCRIAVLAGAEEAVIHKEYHLSSADPKVVSEEEIVPIGRTNYDVADQLANLGMEAIHPSAARMLRQHGIPLRVRHAFEPDHSGTLIDSSYRSDKPKVEIVAGRRGLLAVELFDHNMIDDQPAFEVGLIDTLKRFHVQSVGKDLNANCITHYIACPLRTAKRLTERLRELYPNAVVQTRKVAFVCALGTDMDMPGVLARCAFALGEAGVSILSACQPLRGVDARFVVDDEQYPIAVNALHKALIRTPSRVGQAA